MAKNTREPVSTMQKSVYRPAIFVSLLLLPVLSIFLYQLDSFDPAEYPDKELTRREALFVPHRNAHMLRGSERLGEGRLLAPEDVAFDPKTGVLYTGCEDGWVHRVSLNGSVVEKWVNTAGRPLGIVHGLHGEVIVADAVKGLLNISSEGSIELLTDEAEGLKFKLTDAVDIGRDGTLYFTDASYKYGLHEFIWDILEGRPYGRFLSYNPSTKETRILVRDLYFANGVAVSPDQSFVIFCETALRRCQRYYLEGRRKGSVDMFIDNLPGVPDNIRYDGEGLYWIALSTGISYPTDLLQRYPFIRKVVAIMERYIGRPKIEKNGGAIAVDLDGKPTALYQDRDISSMSSAIKIGDHLYCGSVSSPYILRLNVDRYPATPTV
ncbi:protein STRICTOSIDINE SYNTHASE-LIKE 6-like [Primulina tabacum]|uniref:protein STRICTOSIDINE SYNTHASE-LIKE 6-like n=1 Tax=Primulina tabacum TaxID=48773 RepID=UPI003F5A0205